MKDLFEVTSEEDLKKKRFITIVGGIAAGVIVILIAILLIVMYINSLRDNIVVNGSNQGKLNTNIIQMDANGLPYLNVKTLSTYLGYQFYNGQYGVATENPAECYVRNENEIAMLEMDSDIVYKTYVSDDSTYDYYKMTEKVKRINNELYIGLETIEKVFNTKVSYDAEKNTIYFTTLGSFISSYEALAKDLGYYDISDEFTNFKAMLNGWIVVINSQKEYGVIDSKGNVIIGTKYTNMEYMEGMNEFVATLGGLDGVIELSATGQPVTKIDFAYDDLRLIDNNNGLYLVEINDRQGILNKSGNVLVNLEYEKIGLPNKNLFATEEIKNSYVLYENVIPVMQDDKWGFYDVTGKLITPVKYHQVGAVGAVNANGADQNLLLIPASEGAEGIVVTLKTTSNKSTYGIINTKGVLITSDRFSSVYKQTTGGITEYYMIFGGTIMRVKDLITENSSGVDDDNQTVLVD